jgi:hypothetical protein
MGNELSDAARIQPNPAGPFSVPNGYCTACGVPTAIAPELFDFDSSGRSLCFVAEAGGLLGRTRENLLTALNQDVEIVMTSSLWI